MNTSQGSVASGAASSGAAGSSVVVLVWVLSLFHTPLPSDVAAALVMLIAPVVHLLITRRPANAPPTAQAAAEAVAPKATTP